MNRNMPLVQLCRGNNKLVGNIPSVNVDNAKGAALALNYLLELGHSRIAFIGSERLGDLYERQEALLQF
jgi:DNA-binding LacI/PurR family transcriptional regulator